MKKTLLLVIGVIFVITVYFQSSDAEQITETEKPQIEAQANAALAQESKKQLQVDTAPNIKTRTLPEVENSEPVHDDTVDNQETHKTVIIPLIDDSYKAAATGDWEAFLKYTNEMTQVDEYMPTLQLVTAIKKNAPIYVIEELLKNGASWNSSHANIGVRMRNKKEIIAYMNLGMDIHVDDEALDNPINAMVRGIYRKSNEKRDLFTFLLNSGVEIRKGSDGYHPVTKALIAAKESEEAVFYIFQMMKREADLSDKQISLAKELRIDNPRSYNLLVRNVPEFSEVLSD